MVRRELIGKLLVKDFKDTEKDIYIVFLGDMHLGAHGFMKKELEKYLDWVNGDDNRYIIGMGDYLECATINNSPGTALKKQEINLDDQERLFIELMSPVKDRIIALLSGNHEERTSKSSGHDILVGPARELGVPYLGHEGWIYLKLNNKRKYKVYVHHGLGSSKLPSHSLKTVGRNLLIAAHVDVIAVGHLHKIHCETITCEKPYGLNTYTHECLGVRTGGFLRHPDYARQLMMPPPDIGAPILRFSAIKDDVIFYRDLNTFRYLEGN